MKKTLSEILTIEELKSNAEFVYFRRGLEYYEDGRVIKINAEGDKVTGIVQGTHPYEVSLQVQDGFLDDKCDCPLGRSHDFCKHKVALGLAYIKGEKTSTQKAADRPKSTFVWEEFLQCCSRAELEAIIIKMTPHCPKIVESYRLRNLPLDDATVRGELEGKIDQLIELAKDCEEEDWYDHGRYRRDYYDYHDDDSDSAYQALSEGIEQLQQALLALLEQERLETVLAVTQYGIDQICQHVEVEDDTVSELMQMLEDNFLDSAEAGKPEDIIEMLDRWEASGYERSLFSDDVQWWKMPEPVQELWYTRARETWQKLPKVTLSAANLSSFDYQRALLEKRLVITARTKGEDNFILQILERNCIGSKRILELQDEYERQKMKDKILPLLLKARKFYPHDDKIRDALVIAMRAKKMTAEIISLAWNDFINSPFQHDALDFLLKQAQLQKQRQEQLERALQFLQTKMDKAKGRDQCDFRSRIVKIRLAEKMYAEAWQVGNDGKINENLLRPLAKSRAATSLPDTLQIYRSLLKEALLPAGENAYKEVVSLLKEYKQYMQDADQEDAFWQYIETLQMEYRRRRNFVAMLKNTFKRQKIDSES